MLGSFLQNPYKYITLHLPVHACGMVGQQKPFDFELKLDAVLD